jgi:serine/threonine protein kinase
MATGITPFQCNSLANVIEKVKGTNIQYPESMNSDIKELIKEILVNDPKSRPTIKTILTHRFFAKDGVGEG